MMEWVGRKTVNMFFQTVATGAVCAWPAVTWCLFPRGLFTLHLPARLLLPQQSPVELGRSDHPVRSTDPPAAG